MVTFMVKWTLAAIPAMIMIAILIGVLTAILGGMFGMGA